MMLIIQLQSNNLPKDASELFALPTNKSNQSQKIGVKLKADLLS